MSRTIFNPLLTLISIHSFPCQIPNGPSLRGCFNILSSLIVFSSRWIAKRRAAGSTWWGWWRWLVCHWIIVRSKIVRIVGRLIVFGWIWILICKIVEKTTTLSATTYGLLVIIVYVGEFQLAKISFSLYWTCFWHRNRMGHCNRTDCKQKTPQLHFWNEFFHFRKNWQQKTQFFKKFNIYAVFDQKSLFQFKKTVFALWCAAKETVLIVERLN